VQQNCNSFATEISQFLGFLFKEERKKVLSHLSRGEFSRNSAKIQQFYLRLKVKSEQKVNKK
jgi:hypothetical protein